MNEVVTRHILLLDFRISDPDFRISVLDFRISAPDFRISASDFRISAPDFRISAPDFKISAADLKISVLDHFGSSPTQQSLWNPGEKGEAPPLRPSATPELASSRHPTGGLA